jgi:streptogramin lyase
VLPDWDGAYYWFATTAGIVGTIDTQTGEVHSLQLEGEIIENSIAIGSEGVFILSDQAL